MVLPVLQTKTQPPHTMHCKPFIILTKYPRNATILRSLSTTIAALIVYKLLSSSPSVLRFQSAHLLPH